MLLKLITLVLLFCYVVCSNKNKKKKIFSFAVLGDTHVGGNHFKEVFLRQIIRKLNSFPSQSRPSFIATTGDLTHMGRQEDINKLLEILSDESRIPFLPVFGNHDVRGERGDYNFIASYGKFFKKINRTKGLEISMYYPNEGSVDTHNGKEVQLLNYEFKFQNDFVFYFLDLCGRGKGNLKGYVHKSTLEWLEEKLKKLNKEWLEGGIMRKKKKGVKKVFFLFHHPPYSPTWTLPTNTWSFDEKERMKMMSVVKENVRKEKIGGFFVGHLHVPGSRTIQYDEEFSFFEQVFRIVDYKCSFVVFNVRKKDGKIFSSEKYEVKTIMNSNLNMVFFIVIYFIVYYVLTKMELVEKNFKINQIGLSFSFGMLFESLVSNTWFEVGELRHSESINFINWLTIFASLVLLVSFFVFLEGKFTKEKSFLSNGIFISFITNFILLIVHLSLIYFPARSGIKLKIEKVTPGILSDQDIMMNFMSMFFLFSFLKMISWIVGFFHIKNITIRRCIIVLSSAIIMIPVILFVFTMWHLYTPLLHISFIFVLMFIIWLLTSICQCRSNNFPDIIFFKQVWGATKKKKKKKN